METDQQIFETKASRIFAFDKNLRFVVLVSSAGKLIGFVGRPGVKSLEPPEETAAIYIKATVALAMGESMNKYFGKLRTVILVREKVVLLCFNLLSKIMLVSAEPEFELSKVEQLGRLIDQLNMG